MDGCSTCQAKKLCSNLYKNCRQTPQGELKFSLDPKLTLSTDIESFLHSVIPHNEGFLGCFAKDQVPINTFKHTQYACCVVNLDDSKDPGSHFMVIVRNGSCLLCFDSFALEEHYDVIRPILNKISESISNPQFWYSSYPIQSWDSNACGYFCIWFVLKQFFWRANCAMAKDFKKLFFAGFTKTVSSKVNETKIASEIILNVERILNKRRLEKLCKKLGESHKIDFNSFHCFTTFYT